jgi:hypothetical protein
VPPAAGAALTLAPPRSEPASALPAPLATGFEPDLPAIRTWLEGSGVVIPVLGASGGAGASVAAAALFDVCDAAGRATALIDVADPTRSGLALAGRPSGATHRVGDGVLLARAERGNRGHLHRMAPNGQAVHAGMVPPAQQWFPEGTGAEITIVDVGWDPWATLAAPAAGPGSWWASSAELPEELRPCPVLVCSPTRPSVARAQQLMTRLQPWSRTGRVAEVLALIVCGAPRWPAGVAGVAGREIAELPTFFLPRHRALARHGITPDALPARVQAAAARLTRDWGLA